MYDLREHKELISQLVSEANQNDENWRWSVKSVGKEKARIFWEYLEYCGQKEPYFSIVLENTEDGRWHRPKRPTGRRGSHPQIHDILEVLAMENKNMTAAREWENDPNCFLRMLNSPAQQRSRAARRQKDAERERFNNVLNAVAIGAAAFAVTLLVICFVL